MGVGVAGVAVLVQHEIIAAPFLDQVLGHFDGAVGAAGAVGRDDLGAVGFEQLHPLHADVLRHDYGDLVALQPTDHGKRDACVAAGRLQDRAVGGYLSVSFRQFDHLESDAVFDAAGGVLSFQLGEDSHALLGSHTLQFNKRGVADGVDDAFVGEPSNHKPCFYRCIALELSASGSNGHDAKWGVRFAGRPISLL